MNAKPSEIEKIIENGKTGTQEGHICKVSPFPRPFADSTGRTRAKLGKSDVAFWKARVRPRKLKDGKLTKLLYVRLKVGGSEAWVCLDCADTVTAATKARDLWLSAKNKKLATAIAEFHPKADARPARVCTVGNYVAAARALATVRRTTFAEYEASLRRVVAGVCGIRSRTEKHADRAEWRARVDAVRLDQITPSHVRSWRKQRTDAARAEGGEPAKDRCAHTLSSHLRDARALFSKAILAEVGKTMTLPSPLPLEGIAAAATTRRFVCDLDPRKLYAAADELDADTRTAFDLLLCAGLRRGEADALPWAHVDLTAGTVTIDVTPTFRPKSRESYRTVPLSADVVARLRTLRETNPAAVFVLNGRLKKTSRKPAESKKAVYEYRAAAWSSLAEWLKKQGLRDLTPLHALRKMSGSFIYAAAGIEAARAHLGHRDVSTTARSYITARSVAVDLSRKTS
jgi:integrase